MVRLLNVSPPASLATPQTTRVRLRDNDLPGGIVPSFHPNLAAFLSQFAVQSDGAVIVKTNAATNLIRFLPDGNRDNSYVTPRASYADVFFPVVLLYENIGYEHGYIPMEELSGVRRAGLSGDEKAIVRPLDWQVASH